MLQQTQVATVIPYYRRWMQRFPTLTALAEAPEDEVLKCWEGLGYYTRARNLQRAARQLVHDERGRFPRDPAAVLALPGIGRYTAGAICSIAFGQAQPVLDGNVIRVLTRFVGIDAPVKAAATQRRLWGLAGDLVAAVNGLPPVAEPCVVGGAPYVRECIGRRLVRRNPCGALNQALMELGRQICLARQPKCPDCPLGATCRTRLEGAVQRRPNLGRRPPARKRHVVAIVIENRGRYWVRQRPVGGINGGLWEFPNEATTGAEAKSQQVALLWPAVDPASLERMATIRHTITNHRITLTAWRARLRTGVRCPATDGCWVGRGGLEKLAFAAAHRRLLQRLLC
ncbi:MAG: A/G-specific adenine glycosylase [Verrucomicrobiales bacterium]|nr:A/G-specific adenine glycosylase [Verrucomicrobiales bacterium]